jgi:hypothetical protein
MTFATQRRDSRRIRDLLRWVHTRLSPEKQSPRGCDGAGVVAHSILDAVNRLVIEEQSQAMRNISKARVVRHMVSSGRRGKAGEAGEAEDGGEAEGDGDGEGGGDTDAAPVLRADVIDARAVRRGVRAACGVEITADEARLVLAAVGEVEGRPGCATREDMQRFLRHGPPGRQRGGVDDGGDDDGDDGDDGDGDDDGKVVAGGSSGSGSGTLSEAALEARVGMLNAAAHCMETWFDELEPAGKRTAMVMNENNTHTRDDFD